MYCDRIEGPCQAPFKALVVFVFHVDDRFFAIQFFGKRDVR